MQEKNDPKLSKLREKKCLDERKKDRDQAPTKVVIRRLPPSLTPEVFLEQVSPLPNFDYFYFVKADMSLGINAFTRAYINFPSPEDIYNFRDKFDGYVFVDNKGNEYSAVVEFAPFQKVPKKKMKTDTKKGIIEQDSDYQKFVETLENPEPELAVPIESYLEELEGKKRELKANHGVPKITTPLIEFIRRKKEEKKAAIQRMREERRKREQERRKAREEEKRRRREKREKEKQKDKEQKKDDGPIKLLRNPERDHDKIDAESGKSNKDEVEKPVKEREKLRFSKENREKLSSKLDRQNVQDRVKPGRFADRSKYFKEDRFSEKVDRNSDKFRSMKEEKTSDKARSPREDKAERIKHGREKEKFRDEKPKLYQSNNIGGTMKDDKKKQETDDSERIQQNGKKSTGRFEKDKIKDAKEKEKFKFEKKEKVVESNSEKMGDSTCKFDQSKESSGSHLACLFKNQESRAKVDSRAGSSCETPVPEEARKRRKERPERALYDPRKALERRQQESVKQVDKNHSTREKSLAGGDKAIGEKYQGGQD